MGDLPVEGESGGGGEGGNSKVGKDGLCLVDFIR